MKLLFLLKKRGKGPYGTWNYTSGEHLDSGLYVSAKQVVEMLVDEGREATLVQVVDNNGIDREIAKYKPTHVIIEAFWVVPEKFEVLKKLHPTVTFIVRCHSKLDFLSHEGVVFGWIFDYLKQGVYVGCNSEETVDDLKKLARIGNYPSEFVISLPNFYNVRKAEAKALKKLVAIWRDVKTFKHKPKVSGQFNVGCFGAIRPLKNHMVQALGALRTAENLKLNLQFHINSNRLEGQVGGILKALRAVFSKFPNHKLVEHTWLPHKEFLQLIEQMDLVTQVSLSESFNIVCADAVSMGVPIVSSKELPWLPETYTVDNVNNVNAIELKMLKVWKHNDKNFVVADQLTKLIDYCDWAKAVWLKHFS